jgi:hypothetical protein
MNVRTNISPSRNVTSFGPASLPTQSILGTLGSFLTSWYGMITFILIAMILFWVYYETIGYYFSLGWNKMRWSHDHKEKINIEVPGTPISAELNPVVHPPHQSLVKEIESDVAKALGETVETKQVFNVARNLYKFEDAEPLCKAFGAELATYDQIKQAHKSGADWCNYGWSKGQMALFPTQKETFEKLQTGSEDQRMSCGVPGVNGGYFPNADQRFGVNCYGERPAKSALDDRLEHEPSDIAFDREVRKFKSELDTIPVNPWAPKQWSA